jgi:hypothetical protein
MAKPTLNVKYAIISVDIQVDRQSAVAVNK